MASRRGHNEGSIYQRKDGRWTAVVDLGWRDGKRSRKQIYGKNRREVADKLSVLQHDVRHGLPVTDDRITLDELLNSWLETVVKGSVRRRTYLSYRSVADLHLRPELGHRRIGTLKAQHVQKLLADKLESGLSARTVEMIWQVLRRALKTAVRWDLLVRNIAEQVQPPRPIHKEIDPFTIDEIHRLFATAESDPMNAAITLSLMTGMRRGEVLGLRWSSIDLDQTPAKLTIRETLQRIDGKLQFGEPKSSKSRRTISLPTRASQALRRHRTSQATQRLAAGGLWNDQGLVFTTATGQPIDPRNFLRTWHQLLAKAGLERRSLHEARHSAASLLLSEGVPLKIVQETLGHSTITLTADLYGHLMPEDKDKAAEAMDRALGA